MVSTFLSHHQDLHQTVNHTLLSVKTSSTVSCYHYNETYCNNKPNGKNPFSLNSQKFFQPSTIYVKLFFHNNSTFLHQLSVYNIIFMDVSHQQLFSPDKHLPHPRPPSHITFSDIHTTPMMGSPILMHSLSLSTAPWNDLPYYYHSPDMTFCKYTGKLVFDLFWS